MKTKLFILLLIGIIFSGCRTSKEIGENFSGTEKTESFQETEKEETQSGEKNVREEADHNVREETEKRTATSEKTTEYFPPTADNPQGGVKKSETEKIYITDEKAVTESVEKAVKETKEKYEKLLIEKDVRISLLEKELETLKTEKQENDSRPIQKSEWLWVGLVALIAVIILIFFIIRKVKK